MNRAFTRYGWLTACGVVSILVGCNRTKSDAAPESGAISADSGKATASANRAKVPVTTKSEEARNLYDKGLALADQVQFHDARQLLQQAAAKDPDFAMAHYQLALTSPSNKESLAHVEQAVALSGKASDGERLTILALQAGFNADPAKALEYLKQVVDKYLGDERAHQALAFAYQGQQDYERAVDELNKAIELNPDFSPAYNSLGYAYRPLNKNAEAEQAFKKYIELVPNDPNPYDSYAELLMKTGRFDESIAQYRKALSIDPHFTNSYYAIAGNLMYQGKHPQALAEAQKLTKAARNDGDRRLAFFTKSLIYADQGKTDLALKEMEKQYAFDAKLKDPVQMAQDVNGIGIVLIEAGRPDQAQKRFEQALDIQANSTLSSETKQDAKLAHHYNLGRVALARNDLATAKSEAAEDLKGAEEKQSDFRIRQAHELGGMIAIKEKNFDEAIGELEKANQQDPYVVYQIAVAYAGKGDQAKAKETYKRAAEMYILPTINYVLIRVKAGKQAGGA
jgi:tetratricopeptide (TPR) repeat protein